MTRAKAEVDEGKWLGPITTTLTGKAECKVAGIGRNAVAITITAAGKVESKVARIGGKVVEIMMRATEAVTATTVTGVITAGMVRPTATTVGPMPTAIPMEDMAASVGSIRMP